MKIKDLPKKAARKFGDVRKRVKFALLPARVGDALVWLELYEVLEVWNVDPYVVLLDGQKVAFELGKWIEISRRRYV